MIYIKDSQLRTTHLYRLLFEEKDESIRYEEISIQEDVEQLQDIFMQFQIPRTIEPEFFEFDDLLNNASFRNSHECFKTGLTSEIALSYAKIIGQSKNFNHKEMFVLISFFDCVVIEDEMCRLISIGLFKNDNWSLSLYGTQANLVKGLSFGQEEKSLFIFDVESESGFKIISKTRSSRQSEKDLWNKNCFSLKRKSNDYFQTKELIQTTKDFIKDQGTPIFALQTTEKAEILGKSLDYLKKNDSFKAEDYQNEIFPSEQMMNEFQEYRSRRGELFNTELRNTFELDKDAIKKQTRVFKSVLKLDKNFHVYIHGNRERIKKGVDEEGRKYYIIYYEQEN